MNNGQWLSFKKTSFLLLQGDVFYNCISFEDWSTQNSTFNFHLYFNSFSKSFFFFLWLCTMMKSYLWVSFLNRASIASRPMSRHGSAMGGQRPFSRQSTAMGNGRMVSARPTSGSLNNWKRYLKHAFRNTMVVIKFDKLYLKSFLFSLSWLGRIGSAVGHRPGPVPGTASRLTGRVFLSVRVCVRVCVRERERERARERKNVHISLRSLRLQTSNQVMGTSVLQLLRCRVDPWQETVAVLLECKPLFPRFVVSVAVASLVVIYVALAMLWGREA